MFLEEVKLVNKFVLTIILAFFTTYYSVPLINKLGLKFSIFDEPNERKQHNNFIVRIGGIALLLGVGLPILLFLKFDLFEVITRSSSLHHLNMS